MADLFGALAQVVPAATTLTDAYAVPALRRATVEVVICNRGGAATVRLSQAVGGAADASAQYLLYDFVIPAGETKVSAQISASSGDVFRVYATTASVAFNINGIEEDA
ncbi:MAG: hypothetical protein ACRCYS_05255 [Beijerinckiaceae bacterium]